MYTSDFSALEEAYQSLGDSEKRKCDTFANLFSIIVTADALQTEFINGNMSPDIYNQQMRSLIEQYSVVKDSVLQYTELDQYFRDYLGPHEYEAGRIALQDRPSQIKAKESKVYDAFASLSNVLAIEGTKGAIKKNVESLRTALRDLTSFTNKSFDFEDVLNKIVRICDEDNSYGDDIVFNNRDYYTRIANRYGDLLKQFEKYLQN